MKSEDRKEVAGKRPKTNRARRMTQKCYSNCLSVVRTCALDASRARSTLTRRHAHATAPKELECVGGMGINRHWSRHAFRDIPKAQYTFKSLLVHGILQFTMLITLRCALHRCSSRDIRCWKFCTTCNVSKTGWCCHHHMRAEQI